MQKKLISLLLMGVLGSLILVQSAFAATKISRMSVVNANDSVKVENEPAEEVETNVGVESEVDESITEVQVDEEVCGFQVPEEKKYDSSVVTVRRKLRVYPGEEFRVKVFVKNEGNMPWFAGDSACMGPKIYLGTDKARDRSSIFYSELAKEDNGWTASNRVKMDQKRIDPGEIASFTFWSKAGQNNDVYKEYMTPMVDGVTWMDNGGFSYEVMVGDSPDSLSDLRKKVLYSQASGSVLNINLDGERSVLIDLSDQMGYLMLDGVIIKQFQVSTGKASTPTPIGTTQIQLKQDMRIGHEPPHYMMPNFMWFRAGGYGLHSLPMLGNDNGIFWSEALDHIGIPVSHGCVRMLPDDSDFAYAFLQVGDTVTVQY